MEKNYIPTIHKMCCIMAGYYDYVLGVIPLALFGITGSLSLFGLALNVAVPLAAGVAVLVIGHAMFLKPPVPRAVSETATPHARTINAD
jgi:hypothetical protein